MKRFYVHCSYYGALLRCISLSLSLSAPLSLFVTDPLTQSLTHSLYLSTTSLFHPFSCSHGRSLSCHPVVPNRLDNQQMN